MKRPRPVGKAPQTQFTAKGIAARLVNLNLGRDEDEIFRMVRHYSNHGLIDTVGAVHTGSGRSRVYSDEAMLLAGILFRLNRLGVPVGVMKELLSGLRVHLKNEHQG